MFDAAFRLAGLEAAEPACQELLVWDLSSTSLQHHYYHFLAGASSVRGTFQGQHFFIEWSWLRTVSVDLKTRLRAYIRDPRPLNLTFLMAP